MIRCVVNRAAAILALALLAAFGASPRAQATLYVGENIASGVLSFPPPDPTPPSAPPALETQWVTDDTATNFALDRPIGLNWYAYAAGNPVSNVDPTGNVIETAWDVANIGLGVYSLQDNISNGSWGWAAVDAVGLVYDVAATAVPFLPAGVSAGVKAYRAGNTAVHSVNAGMDIARVSNRVHNSSQAMNGGAMAGRQAADAGRQLHRQIAAQTSNQLRYFDNTFMAGANGASGRQPDLVGPVGVWADITTTRQWNRHVNSYSSNFGTGIPILYERGIGVVETTRLLPGAGVGLSGFGRK